MAITPNRRGESYRMPVICINDSGRPSDIPASKWPVKGKPYTVTSHVVMHSMGGRMGVTLEEISLEGCYPYKYYLGDRFGIPADGSDLLARAEELLREAQREFDGVGVGEAELEAVEEAV